MGRLTTHVLDTTRGRPAAGVGIALFRADAGTEVIATAVTNQDGRCDKPLLEGAAFTKGRYQLVFQTGAYFAKSGLVVTDPPFLDEVVIRFGVAAPDQHYHVPLLLSPFGYSTYRGS